VECAGWAWERLRPSCRYLDRHCCIGITLIAAKVSLRRWQAYGILQDRPARAMPPEKGVTMLFASRPSCIKRLLIIEDDPLVAFDNERTLKHGGYDVVATVDSGEAAVAVLASEQVDAL